MSSWTTRIELTNDWLFLPDLVIVTREANAQVPLPETSAISILYRSPSTNVAKIFRTNDIHAGVEGQSLLPDETNWDEVGSPGNSVSLREWFVKGTAGGELLDIEMIN